ncbi:F-box/kelch-repeat protein At3g23880-like [Spinacia oleracea]|uniref:F-box/kelch-repeat protein At3g23880-like n=1 Tax=Spinacia oleracea TaxID=3562 RepID=A0ABM3RNP3_SPIOL|nr:F-box/kelch-repeat protein At3g23880-like [Spinacia oleracea]
MEIRENPNLNPNPNISDDLLMTNILPRLPPKSLIRYKTVCKQWRSIISNPNFIESNLRLSKTNHNNNGVLVPSLSKSLSRERVETLTYISYDDFSTTDFQFNKSKYGFYNLGSCNGLQCCWLNCGEMCVWNPITSECRKIPDPLAEYPCQYVSGFGYIPSLDDYKLVILDLREVIRVYCYTLRSCDTEWKQLYADIGLGRISPLYGYLCPGIVLPNSKSHWLVRYNIDDYNNEDDLIILGFDMEMDTINTVNPPEEIIVAWQQRIRIRHSGVYTCLSSIKDDLCIAMTARAYGEGVSGCLQVWRLERYGDSSSWNKFLKLNNVEIPTSSCNFFTLYESRDGVKLLTHSTSKVWSLYLKSKSDHQIITLHEWFEDETSQYWEYFVPAVSYVESLVSPFMTYNQRT